MVRTTVRSRLRNIHDLVPEDDLAQEMILARIAAEARGEDPGAAATAAREAFCRAERAFAARHWMASDVAPATPHLDWLPEAASVARLRVEPPVARKRGRPDPDKPYRDLAMFICYVAGMKTWDIARAWKLHQAPVSKAIARMRARTGITRARDMAVRVASSKGRRFRVDGRRVTLAKYRPGDAPAASASYWRTPR